MNSSLPSPIASSLATPEPPVKVKSEAEIQALRDLQLKSLDQRVKIYIGHTNTIFEVCLEDLDKSPILKVLFNDIGTNDPFVMHPELAKVSADHFQSVREFLLTDEYMPAILDNPQGEDASPKKLDGCTTVEHYRQQALRNGHLYVIAKSLKMQTLLDLVYRKITEAQFEQYGLECLLSLAMTIFSRPNESQFGGICNPVGMKDEEGRKEDVMEEWLVENLGDRFQPVMINHAQLFFDVANHGACAARKFGERVMKRKVKFWDALQPNAIAIEDDD